jgi:6-phospho-3-hexuloisomerase
MDPAAGTRSPAFQLATDELTTLLSSISSAQFDDFVGGFVDLKRGRVFFSGQGRSGLSAQMVAMRFMHMGFDAHFVGEPTAPSVRAGDTLVIVSGSGKTPVSVGFARIAQGEGARVLLVTHQEESPLRQLADRTLVLPAAASRQFGGTLFEQAALVLLDTVVLELMTDLPEADVVMLYNHTNLQ